MKTKTGRQIAILSLAAAIATMPRTSFAQTPPSESAAEPKAEVKAEAKTPVLTPPAPPPLNKDAAVDAPEKVDLEAEKVDPKRQKFVSLYIGIEHQEPLPYIPPDAKFKGDFKKVTHLSINREQGILLFQATKEGVATLTIHDKKDQKLYEFRIDVKRSNQTKIVQEMRALLSDIEGITIKIVNNKVVVDGQVLLPRDMNRIISVVAQYGDMAASLVVLSPVAQRKIAQAISNDINNPEITVRTVNDKFILEGTAADQNEKDRAEAIAQMYVPDMVKEAGEKEGTIVKLRKTFVLNLIQLKPAPPKDPGKIIQMVIHFVELNKNYQKGFKFEWAPTLEDKSTVSFTQDSRQPGGVISSITGIVSNLLPKLNWAKTHGHARVLQSTSLIVLDGQAGDLQNQVKVPYQTVNAQGQASTAFEDVGLNTSLTPQILNARSDSVRINMKFTMKSLLGMTEKGPMISNNFVQTVVIVRSGQSAAVGGLITNSTSTDYNKMPKGTGFDPIFLLHASKAFQRNQSQFVVFVTPIIKSSASQGAEKIKEKFRIRD